MNRLRCPLVFPLVLVAAVALSACGSDGDAAVDDQDAASPELTAVVTASPPEATGAEEDGDEGHDKHGDEDHDDEDHDDEDHDEDDHDDHGDESGGSLGAHEHGAAELSVAWIDAEVAIDLISPTFNVFGFEYEPTTDTDLAIVADRTEALVSEGVMVVNDEAGCTLDDPVVTEVEREGSHSEITVSWRFTCENADAIEQIDAAGLFSEFPDLEDVDVQWISESDQSSAELTPSSPRFTLQR